MSLVGTISGCSLAEACGRLLEPNCYPSSIRNFAVIHRASEGYLRNLMSYFGKSLGTRLKIYNGGVWNFLFKATQERSFLINNHSHL